MSERLNQTSTEKDTMSILLRDPVVIAPNLEPGVRIGPAAWVTISYSGRQPRKGRTRYRWTVMRHGLPDVIGHDLQSGCGGGSLREGLASLLSFLSAFAEEDDPRIEHRYGDRSGLFPAELWEWAHLNSDEIGMAQVEIEENPECMKEEQ